MDDTPPTGRVLAEEPPPPPEIERRLALTRKQWFGLPLLLTIPILTLFGVFGERSAETSAVSRSVVVRVRYPARFRYRQVQSLVINVRSTAPNDLDTVHVSIDTAYVTRFSSVRVEPPPRDAFVVDLARIKPGESRLVSAELWGEHYGRHPGRIVVWTHGDTAAASISTFVFP